MNTSQKIKRFIKLSFLWFFIEPKLFWFSLILTISPLLFLYFIFSKDNMIRVGVFLQWIGVFSVFFNIRETKKKFNKPNSIDNFKKWFRNKPKFNPKPAHIKPEGIFIDASVVGLSLIDMFSWDKEKNTEENMRININRCIEDIYNLENKFKDEVGQINASLSNDISEIKSLLNSLKSDIENVATGGLNLTFVSSAWILIGVTISTIPDDIICILNWLSKNLQFLK